MGESSGIQHMARITFDHPAGDPRLMPAADPQRLVRIEWQCYCCSVLLSGCRPLAFRTWRLLPLDVRCMLIRREMQS